VSEQEVTVFDVVGGQPFFDDLAARFYRRVASDPVLRPLYADDLAPGERHLALFLGQYWGGPSTYSDERGHPRLRMRHHPFAIGDAERDAWFSNMAAAVRESGLDPEIEGRMLSYFGMAASHLVNTGS
jgi:hemoglobin